MVALVPKIAVQRSSSKDSRKPDILVFMEKEQISYELQSNPADADYIFLFSQPLETMLEWSHRFKDKILILLTGEAYSPDFNLFDYAFGFDKIEFGDRYLQIHQHALFYDTTNLNVPISIEKIKDTKTRFCNFIYSNPSAHPNRDIFFKQLNAYKKVDSLGKHLHNVNYSIGDRNSNSFFTESIIQKKPYRFSVAFENAKHPGYNTEKIISSMLANSIPIYWGDPNIEELYNCTSFINCHNYNSFDEVIEEIKELEHNKERYYEMLLQPWRNEDQQHTFLAKKEQFKTQLKFIFTQPYKDAFRKPVGTYNNLYTEKLALLRNKEKSIANIIRRVKNKFTH